MVQGFLDRRRGTRSDERIEHRPVDDIALEAVARGLRIPETPLRDLSDIACTLFEEDVRIIEENVKWMDEGDLALQRA